MFTFWTCKTSECMEPNRNRIFCFVLTLGNLTSKRYRSLSESWPAHCDSAAFLTDDCIMGGFQNLHPLLVNTPTPLEGKISRELFKTFASVEHAYKHIKEFDWFLSAYEDTFVNISSVRLYLSRFKSFDLHYFGYAWDGLLKTGHKSGYILSHTSLRWLKEVVLSDFNSTLSNGQIAASEYIRYCLQEKGVFSGIDPVIHNSFIPQKSMKDTQPKLILAWNMLVRRDVAKLVKRQSENCPVQCILSSNKSLIDQADAVTFFMHPWDLVPLPTSRYTWQRYVFINTETYVNGQFELPLIGETLFNWSMTYRHDSDIRLDYYGQLLRHTQSPSNWQFVHHTALHKGKMIAWVVSRCEAHSKRAEYVNELRNYVSVDQFGGCVKNVNSSNICTPDGESIGRWCANVPFTTDYRFYLAFENSVCVDYVSEKFYQALDRLMVPIVLRGADYLKIAPRGSYIAADNFRSPKDLANYLHYLASNPDEYLKYFEYTKTNSVVWKEKHMLEEGFCRLCRMLHENRTGTIGTPMHQKWTDIVSCVEGYGEKLIRNYDQ